MIDKILTAIGTFFILLFAVAIVIVNDNQAKYIRATEERAGVQTELHAACIDMLHLIYKENPEKWKEYQQTKEYKRIDSLKQGDWEDFYLY